jgi:hypothetical protein
MNPLVKDIIMIVSGLIGGIGLLLIKNKVFSSAKKEVEEFIPDKLKEGLTDITSKVKWSKTLSQELSIRTWLIRFAIAGIILGVVFGYGWYRGTLGKPVLFDLKGKEAIIQLNEHYLKIEKDGTAKVVDKDGKILKTIKVKDIDGLRQALRPYGFKLEPIVVAGGSMGESGAGFEAGAGVSYFKWYKTKLDAFLTNRGIYPLAVSYSITDNSGIGLGAGLGFKGDKRVILYYKWRF